MDIFAADANGHVSVDGEEMSMLKWLKGLTGWQAVETYKFAIQKSLGRVVSIASKKYHQVS